MITIDDSDNELEAALVAARAMLAAIERFLVKPSSDLTADDWQALIDARASAMAAGIGEK